MSRKTKFESHTLRLEVAPPYAISDNLFDKWLLRLKNTNIEDITPHGNFLFGNKTGALWLRVEIDMRFGFTEKQAKETISDIFKNLRL